MKVMPKVGDRFFDKAVGNAARGLTEPKITEVQVVKSGKKFFSCVDVCDLGKQYATQTQFFIDRGECKQKTNYCQDHKLYESKQSILDEEESNRLNEKIKYGIFGVGEKRLSLTALRKIVEIAELDSLA